MPREIIDVQEFYQRLSKTPELTHIDVREAAEYQAYHVPGTRLFPLSEFQPTNVLTELGLKAESDSALYVLCQVGGRAMQACELLDAAGFSNTVLIDGGTMGWANAGYDLEAG